MIKNILNSFFMAFSMYSKIPMPNCEWKEENMKYSMCFFPIVGVIIALLIFEWKNFAYSVGIGEVFIAAVCTLVPILVTGGIHIDGYIDTVDALSSYKSCEDKLKIMKDSHIGAFALIKTVSYMILYFAIWTEIPRENFVFACMSFIISRALSAIGVVNFKYTSTSSLAKQFSKSSDKKIVTISMCIYLIILEAIMCAINIPIALGVLFTALVVFVYYRYTAYKNFGGITGDTAGYFLQLCELWVIIAVMILSKII